MRCSTLVLSLTLFYSLSFVNAIPHDVDEKRHWLHKRQNGPASSTTSDPVITSSTVSENPSPTVVSPTTTPSTPRPTSRTSPSSTTTPRPSTPTPTQSSESSLPTISSSSSSSSSSSRTRSSSSSSSTITTTTTNRPDTNQGYTSNRHFTSTRVPSDTRTSEGGVETGTRSGNSFLKNKAAMGSTFAIVGLVCVALIGGVVFYLTKKARQRRREDEVDTYFEKLPANNKNNANNPNLGGGNDYGLGPSATDLTTPAHNPTYMPRDVHYGATGQYPAQYPNYNGLEYPPDRGSVVDRPVSFAPGTAYAAAMSQRGQYHYEGQVEDPNAVPNHPFADPENRVY